MERREWCGGMIETSILSTSFVVISIESLFLHNESITIYSETEKTRMDATIVENVDYFYCILRRNKVNIFIILERDCIENMSGVKINTSTPLITNLPHTPGCNILQQREESLAWWCLLEAPNPWYLLFSERRVSTKLEYNVC